MQGLPHFPVPGHTHFMLNPSESSWVAPLGCHGILLLGTGPIPTRCFPLQVPSSENTLVFVSPRQSLCFTNEATEAQGACVAPPGPGSQSPAEPGCTQGHYAHHYLPLGHMAPYEDGATVVPGPRFSVTATSITCHPTVPIWTCICSQTSIPVWVWEIGSPTVTVSSTRHA